MYLNWSINENRGFKMSNGKHAHTQNINSLQVYMNT